MADYLASDSDLNVDGLLYPSVQVAGDHQNVVLFRRASRVRSIDLPPRTEVSVHLDRYDEDEGRLSYWVSERVNHSGLVPALQDTGRGITLADSRAMCEFIEETVPATSMMMGSAEQRAEIRRLVAWADDCLYAPLILPLLVEAFGVGRQPESVSRAAVENTITAAEMHLDEVAYWLDRRAWLAGPTLSLADLAIAAHLSVADHFGAIAWTGHVEVQTWYAVLKCRRSFQPLLADHIEGVGPPPHYSAIDP